MMHSAGPTCRRVRLLGVALLVLVLSAGAKEVSAQAFRTESGTVEFVSSVPFHTFTGRSNQLVGRISLEDRTVDFYVDLETLDTGIGKRDKDMRETLDTETYPFAEFFGTLSAGFDAERTGEQPVTVSGRFTVHGVSREVEIEGTLTRTETGLHVIAEWALNLDDYDIEPPSLLIMKVDEVQQVRLDALLQPE